MKVKPYVNSRGERIGILQGDTYTAFRRSHSFVKNGIKYSGHLYIKGKGYPISDDVLQDLKKEGCTKIRIKEENADGNFTYYNIPLQDYLDAKPFQWGDYDKQRCVPKDDYKEGIIKKQTFKTLNDYGD